MWWQTTDFVRYASVSFGLTFKGAWLAFEAPGVELAFPDPNGKQDAIDYAGAALAGVGYCDDGSTIERSIIIDGRGQYPQVGGD